MKQELLKKANKCFIFNKEVAKLMPNKTMTRRVIQQKILNEYDLDKCIGITYSKSLLSLAPYKVGDIVWGREPARVVNYSQDLVEMTFKYADENIDTIEIPERFLKDYGWDSQKIKSKWILNKKGIPNGCIKEMARYFYKITSVRVEKLQDISDEDCIKEGIEVEPESLEWYKDYLVDYDNFNIKFPKESFNSLWDKTAKKGVNDWDSNPYVWVIEYEKIQRIINEG